MSAFLLISHLFFLFSTFEAKFEIQTTNKEDIRALELSQKLLQDLKENKDWDIAQKRLESISYKELKASLKSNEQLLAFWINTYNSYIQIQLKKNPKLYQDRGDFFSEESISIAGISLSFDDIEHSILRKAEWKYGFGYIKNPFISDEIENLQVKETDQRIHFALNCGAKSCPKIAIYSDHNLDEELNTNAKAFLKENSNYNPSKKVIYTTPLFSWFKGDFGGEKEILTLLKYYGIIPAIEEVEIKYQDYDWTMKLDNYAKY